MSCLYYTGNFRNAIVDYEAAGQTTPRVFSRSFDRNIVIVSTYGIMAMGINDLQYFTTYMIKLGEP